MVRTRELNRKLLIVTLIVIAVLAPAAYFLHSFQIGRLSHVFIARAQQLETEAEWTKAAAYIQSYLRLRPDDSEQYVRLAQTYGKTTEKSPQNAMRAIRLYRQALGFASDSEKQLALRRELIPLMLDTGQYKQAEIEVMRLPKLEQPDEFGRHLLADGQDRRFLARASYGRYMLGIIDGAFMVQFKYQEQPEEWELTLDETFRQAIDLLPGDYALAVTLAAIYRQHPDQLSPVLRVKSDEQRGLLADAIVQSALDHAPDDALARLASHQYKLSVGLEADADLDRALELEQGEPEILISAARRAERRAKIEAENGADQAEVDRHRQIAIQYYERVIELDPEWEIAYVRLGSLYLLSDRKKAHTVWEEGLKKLDNRSVTILVNLVDSQIDNGDLDSIKGKPPGAEDNLERLDQLIPQLVAFRFTRNQQQDARRLEQILRGKLSLARNDAQGAIGHLRQGVAGLEDTSEHSDVAARGYPLLAFAYSRLEQWDLAATTSEELVRRLPGAASHGTRATAATAWVRAGQPKRAVAHLRHVATERDDPEMWLMLAQALVSEYRMTPDDGLVTQFNEAVQQAARIGPDGNPMLDRPWRLDLLIGQHAIIQTSVSPQDQPVAEAAHLRLKAAEKRFAPNSEYAAEFYGTSAIQYQALGFPSDADGVLQKLKLSSADPIEWTLAQVQVYRMRDELDAAKTLILETIPSAAADDLGKLRSVLAQVTGDSGDVQRQLREIESPTTAVLVQLLEMDFQDGDLSTAKKYEEKLAELEAESGGVYWKFYRARRLLAGAEDSEDKILAEAVRLQADVETARPNWSQAHFLKGIINQTQGNADAAIAAYERAIELGERRVVVFEMLAQLLYAENRREEADEVLARLGQHVARSSELSALGMMVAANQGDLAEAIRRGEDGVNSRPDDPSAYVFLAQVYVADNQNELAEKTLLKATEVAPDSVLAWSALVSFFNRIGKAEKASEALASLAQNAKIESAPDRELVMAEHHERLGDREKASQHFAAAQAAMAGAEDTIKARVLFRYAGFEVDSGNLDEAIKKLEQARQYSSDPNIVRALASALVARGKDSDFSNALKLVGQQQEETAGDILDLRLKGLLLSRTTEGDYGEHLRKAIDIYESLVDAPATGSATKKGAAMGDRLMLAKLYSIQPLIARPKSIEIEDEDDWIELISKRFDAANDLFLDVVTQPDRTASQIASYITFLMLHGRRSEAQTWLKPLRDLAFGNQPNDPKRTAAYAQVLTQLGFEAAANVEIELLESLIESSTTPPSPVDMENLARLKLASKQLESVGHLVNQIKLQRPDEYSTLDLQVRWLHQAGRASEIEPQLRAFAERFLAMPSNSGRASTLQLTIANLLLSLEMHKEAIVWFRMIPQKDARSYGGLVISLVHEGHIAEAVAECRRSADADGSTMPASVLAIALIGAPANTDFGGTDEILDAGIRESPNNANLLLAVANLRAKQKRVEEAARLYRQILVDYPNHVVTMNNLATLLSEASRTSDDAVRYADYAIMNAGLVPALLDTKGTILLYRDEIAEAEKLLQMACNAPSPDPRFLFHLAIVFEKQGKRNESSEVFQRAINRGLEKQLLTPQDLKYLSRFKTELSLAD